MADYSGEQDFLNSHLALFNQIIRSRGQTFLDRIDQEIQRLVVNGADQADATRLVMERTISGAANDLDKFRDDLVREMRNLISQATVGAFQSRLDGLAQDAMVNLNFTPPPDTGPGVFIWVSVLSSATCQWDPRSAKYIMNGKHLTEMNFCANRHGLRGNSDFWDSMGRPREGETVCLGNCECTLVPESFAKSNPGLLGPVDLTPGG